MACEDDKQAFNETIEDEENSDDKRKTQKNEYEAFRVRKFQESWRKEFPWLIVNGEKSSTLMFCQVCLNHPETANRSSSLFIGSNSFRKSNIQSHAISVRHKLCMGLENAAVTSNTTLPEDQPLDTVMQDNHMVEIKREPLELKVEPNNEQLVVGLPLEPPSPGHIFSSQDHRSFIRKRRRMHSMERWNGCVAVVTGASSGIGEGVARALVDLGMHVIGCDKTVDSIENLAKDLSNDTGSLTTMCCDVTNEEDVKSLFQHIRTDPSLGSVHVIVNAADMAQDAPLLSSETSQWKDMLDVNILGVLTCTREAVRLMEETGVDDGHIFLLNSMSGCRPHRASHFYTATKCMLSSLTQGLRAELRQKYSHTRVTAISPGVETDVHSQLYTDPSQGLQIPSSTESVMVEDVSDAVVYALTAPPHLQVHDIVLGPTVQVS